jgi:hypothetical protein
MKYFQKNIITDYYGNNKEALTTTISELLDNGVIQPIEADWLDGKSIMISNECEPEHFVYKGVKYDANIIRENVSGKNKFPSYIGYIFSVNDVPVYIIPNGEGSFYFNEDKGLLVCTAYESMIHVWFEDNDVETFHMEGGYIIYPNKKRKIRNPKTGEIIELN